MERPAGGDRRHQGGVAEARCVVFVLVVWLPLKKFKGSHTTPCVACLYCNLCAVLATGASLVLQLVCRCLQASRTRTPSGLSLKGTPQQPCSRQPGAWSAWRSLGSSMHTRAMCVLKVGPGALGGLGRLRSTQQLHFTQHSCSSSTPHIPHTCLPALMCAPLPCCAPTASSAAQPPAAQPGVCGSGWGRGGGGGAEPD
jgi:hypothetical protein